MPPRKPQAGLLEKESRLRMPRAGELGPGGDLHPSALPKRGMSPTCFTDRVGRRPPLHTTPAPTSGLTPDPFRPSEPANRATQQGHSWQAVSCSRAGHPARFWLCTQQAGSGTAKSSTSRETHSIPVLTVYCQLLRVDADEGLCFFGFAFTR